MLACLPILVAFVAGSIPFGLLLARARGVDLRAIGSGNIGATNVWRAMGKGFGITCFALDFLKGLLPVLFVQRFDPSADHPAAAWLQVGTALAAILGHNYSPLAGFKGGKGVATSAGGLAALSPWALLAGLFTFGLSLKLSRMVSLASMVAAAVLVLVYGLLSLLPAGSLPGHEFSPVIFGFLIVVAGLVVWRHQSNIARIAAGTESKIGSAVKAGEKPGRQ